MINVSLHAYLLHCFMLRLLTYTVCVRGLACSFFYVCFYYLTCEFISTSLLIGTDNWIAVVHLSSYLNYDLFIIYYFMFIFFCCYIKYFFICAAHKITNIVLEGFIVCTKFDILYPLTHNLDKENFWKGQKRKEKPQKEQQEKDLSSRMQ